MHVSTHEAKQIIRLVRVILLAGAEIFTENNRRRRARAVPAN